jgi:hypothetical protein
MANVNPGYTPGYRLARCGGVQSERLIARIGQEEELVPDLVRLPKLFQA